MNVLLWLVAAGYLLHAATVLRAALAVPRLPAALPGPAPSVSIVVAMRDEARDAEAAVRGFLAQRDVDLELIVADDRSRDATSEVLARLAAAEPRLRVVTIRALPQGWLGKCHALHVAGAAARGEWLLFSDADQRLVPDAVRRAVDAARASGADHLVLAPNHAPTTPLGRACLLAFRAALVRQMDLANRDHPRGFLGVGAFNLVRARTWRAVGGHARLRMEVLEDVGLALLLRTAGFRTRAYDGAAESVVDWGGTPRALLQVLEKNGIALLRYQDWLAVAAGVAMPGVWLAAWAGPFLGGAAGWAAFAGLCSAALPAALLARRLGWQPWLACLVPLAVLLPTLALLRSWLLARRRGGVRWRDTFYPLAELRRGRAW
ncbi:MAG: glycosyltransferase [Planctomycetes bacterium]|nr:glycosyltransferase [Planctomycetota bacterium]